VGTDAEETPLAHSIALARDGDAEAFRCIFLRFGKPVLSFIYGMIGNRARAEELTQESFIRAFRALGSLRNPDQFSTWLFGIARNVVRESIKAKYRRGEDVPLDDPVALSLADQRSGPDDELEASELGRRIRSSLSNLHEDFRTVFVLKVLHQMSFEEIAAITGHSIGKLKTDLHRARLEMRKRLLPYLEESGWFRGRL